MSHKRIEDRISVHPPYRISSWNNGGSWLSPDNRSYLGTPDLGFAREDLVHSVLLGDVLDAILGEGKLGGETH